MTEPLENVFSDLSNRPAGTFMRVAKRVVPGVAKVQAQIAPYAEAWQRHNRAVLQQAGPLWVVLGDSMAQGIGASRYDNGWVGQLDRLLRKHGSEYRMLNLSMSGARVEDVLGVQLPALQTLGLRPQLVTVLIGSNDLARKAYRMKLVENYQKLLVALPPGSYLASPFGETGVGRSVNALLRQQTDSHGIRLIDNDLGQGLRQWRGKLAEDHFHPNDKGYADLAQLYYHAIRK